MYIYACIYKFIYIFIYIPVGSLSSMKLNFSFVAPCGDRVRF